MPVFTLFVSYQRTGHTTVLTFKSQFDRALEMIARSAQPVVLTMRDYPDPAQVHG